MWRPLEIMMLRKSFISSFVAVAALAATPAFAQTLAGVDALSARAVAKGAVRVIVGFAEPATAKALDAAVAATDTARADETHRLALRGTQRAILASTFGAAVAEAATGGTDAAATPRSITLMDVVPALAVTVNQDELQRLAADPRVTSISEDRLSKPTLIQSTGIIRMTGAGGGWVRGATGTNRVVAVLDTGVNRNHEFLKFSAAVSKVVSEACFNTNAAAFGSHSRCPGGAQQSVLVGSGADCTAFEGCGHGTHVAGIAAGKNTSQNPGEPSRGVAFNAGILAIDVFSRFDHTHASAPCGSGATVDCLLSWDSDQIKAMERVFALRGGIGPRKIASLNMSLGGGSSRGVCDASVPTYAQVVTKLRNAGIAVVIAAGNEGFTNAVAFPGCISTATTVAASSKTTAGNPEKIASYSNMGGPVDVFAPGGDFGYPSALGNASLILASYKGSNATYDHLAGTSMAAPHVAGIFAAIKSKPSCATKTVTQIENAMKATGLAIADTRSGGSFTRKRVNVAAVIASLCP